MSLPRLQFRQKVSGGPDSEGARLVTKEALKVTPKLIASGPVADLRPTLFRNKRVCGAYCFVERGWIDTDTTAARGRMDAGAAAA
jgi:hypothetical protein